MCQLNERAQPPCQCLPFETSEMEDTYVYLIRPAAPTPRSRPSELQNLPRNLGADLPKKNSQSELTDITVWVAWL